MMEVGEDPHGNDGGDGIGYNGGGGSGGDAHRKVAATTIWW